MSTLKNQLVKQLAANEHVVHIVSWDDLVNEWESKKGVSRTAANYASPAKDSITAAKLIKEFGLGGKVVIKNYGGKAYVLLKGYPGARKILRGTRYLTDNPKVVRMAVGPKGIKSAAKGGFVITVVLCTGVHVFDYFIRDTATMSELLGNVTSDIVKIGISSIAAATAGLTVGSAAVIGGVAAAPLIAAIAVGVATGYVLDKIDEKVGATAALINAYEKIGVSLMETVRAVREVPKKIDREIYRYERWMIRRAISGALRY